ncbi:MAG: alpha/beta fold hydrolase [Steroidobacteraceae bacterium]
MMPQLVILPGLDGTGARITPFLREMQRAVPVRVVKYPPDLPLGYAELESLVRQELPRGERYVLLAESFSGPIAIRVAADPPPDLAGLILCGTFARNPLPWLRPVRALAVRVPFKSLPRWLRAPLLWGSGDPRRAPPGPERASAGVSRAVIRRRLQEVLTVDVTMHVAAIGLPTLILRATRDRIVPRAATRLLVQRAPRAQVADIEGPHLLLQSRPAESAATVLRFLRRWN